MRVLIALTLCLLAVQGEDLVESIHYSPEHKESHVFHTGVLQATAKSEVLFSRVFRADAEDAIWLRVNFEKRTKLGGATLLITSLKDGYYQRLNKLTLSQWKYSSAYFNGNAVRVDIIGAPEHGHVEVDIEGLTVGTEPKKEASQKTLCDGFDGRVWHKQPAVARYMISGGGGCTIWLIDDENHCFLTAGHCGSGNGGTAQFNVPMSSSSGGIQHPHPDDQYTLDTDSVQYQNGGIGRDWKYVGAFPNSNTGKSPGEAQGDWQRLLRDSRVEPKAGDLVEHFGFGTSSYPDRTFSQVQKGTRNKIYSIDGSAFRHRCDTTGGDSGSSVMHMEPSSSPIHPDGRWRGRAIAIHTHGGCTSSPTSANAATFIPGSAALQEALKSPKGVCVSKNATGLLPPQ